MDQVTRNDLHEKEPVMVVWCKLTILSEKEEIMLFGFLLGKHSDGQQLHMLLNPHFPTKGST